MCHRLNVRHTTLTVALAALLTAFAVVADQSRAASTSIQSSCTFLSLSEAIDAMGVATGKLFSGSAGSDSGGCTYIGSPKRGAAGTYTLTLAVYPPGLTGFKGFAKAVCKVNPGACKYSRVLLVERDPLRYMRLLYAAVAEAGDVVDFSNTFPGPGPAFIWQPRPPFVGTVMVFYVPRTKQFATTFCKRIYGTRGGGHAEEDCAYVAARNVYLELTVR